MCWLYSGHILYVGLVSTLQVSLGPDLQASCTSVGLWCGAPGLYRAGPSHGSPLSVGDSPSFIALVCGEMWSFGVFSSFLQESISRLHFLASFFGVCAPICVCLAMCREVSPPQYQIVCVCAHLPLCVWVWMCMCVFYPLSVCLPTREREWLVISSKQLEELKVLRSRFKYPIAMHRQDFVWKEKM